MNEMIVFDYEEAMAWRDILNEIDEVKTFNVINESDYSGVQYRIIWR